MQGVLWNCWHGCRKKSEGCLNCYVFSRDRQTQRDAEAVFRTKSFHMPIVKNRKGEYKYPSGTLFWTCFTSDFLLDAADEWRVEAFDMIRQRKDCSFLFITKRIERLENVLPKDWGEGWDNVTIGVTTENQRRADERLPILCDLPIKHKCIITEPLLEKINLEKYLGQHIEEVIAGGESGRAARLCKFDWVMDLREQCRRKNVTFTFKQTGAKFELEHKVYAISRKDQHRQAKKAAIDFYGYEPSRLKSETPLQNKQISFDEI